MKDCPGKQTTVRNSVLQNELFILTVIFPVAALHGGRGSEGPWPPAIPEAVGFFLCSPGSVSRASTPRKYSSEVDSEGTHPV